VLSRPRAGSNRVHLFEKNNPRAPLRYKLIEGDGSLAPIAAAAQFMNRTLKNRIDSSIRKFPQHPSATMAGVMRELDLDLSRAALIESTTSPDPPCTP